MSRFSKFWLLTGLFCLISVVAIAQDISEAPSDWQDVEPAIRACLDAHASPSPSVLEQQGVNPDDPRLETYYAKCREIVSKENGQRSVQSPSDKNITSYKNKPSSNELSEKDQIVFWITGVLGGLLDIFIVRRPLMAWYRGGWWYIRGAGPVDILLKQIWYRLGFEVFIFFISCIPILVGIYYIMKLVNS